MIWIYGNEEDIQFGNLKTTMEMWHTQQEETKIIWYLLKTLFFIMWKILSELNGFLMAYLEPFPIKVLVFEMICLHARIESIHYDILYGKT